MPYGKLKAHHKKGRKTVIVKKKCLICGFDRVLDRAHLIPRRVTKGLIGYQKLGLFNKKNVILLCRNCHFLFDHNRLNEEEWIKLRPILNGFREDILMIANSNLIPVNKRSNKDTPAKEKIVKKWVYSLVPNFLIKNAR